MDEKKGDQTLFLRMKTQNCRYKLVDFHVYYMGQSLTAGSTQQYLLYEVVFPAMLGWIPVRKHDVGEKKTIRV